jgi:alkylhydroperoxidase family enzyme
MSFIETPAESPLYDADLASQGYVSNYVRVLAHRPDVVEAWKGLSGAVRGTMDWRRYELATLAAARAIRSSYCCLAHAKVMGERWFSHDELAGVLHGGGPLDDVDRAVMAYAAKVATDASAITQADVDALKAVGLTDPEILDVALAAGLRCFFSKTLDAVGAVPDARFRTVFGDELREALTVGREVAAG